MSEARVRAYGEAATLVELDPSSVSGRASDVLAAARALRVSFPECDVVSGGAAILLDGVSPSDVVARRVELALAAAEHAPDRTSLGRRHVVPVVYDGPDREEAAATLGMTVDELVRRHVERELTVELLGFLPGFGYLGPLDPKLSLPRRASPRPHVPAGCVGVAGEFSGIYPFDSPGGWNWLGRAPTIRLFDGDRTEPCLFTPGDRVRFESIEAGDVPKEGPRMRPVAEPSSGRALVVERSSPGVTIQDAGRPRQLGRGIPLSGALDPERLVAANRAVGNGDDAAALEIPFGSISLRARGDVVVSLDGARAIRLRDGELWETNATGRARIVAVRGGIDVPTRLGSRSTLLVARWGGFLGRALRRGDAVPVGELEERPLDVTGETIGIDVDAEELEVDPGPHLERFPAGAFERFLRGEFIVSSWCDRTGQRLEGTSVLRHGLDSASPVPMMRGAIQIATDGTPLVLGPDHPVTGGYPVIAVLRRNSWGRLARRPPGARVRFRG